MSAESHGRCAHCNVIWKWRATKHAPKVTKGEAFCETCGGELDRTAAGLAKHITIKDGTPIRGAVAAVLRAKRSHR